MAHAQYARLVLLHSPERGGVLCAGQERIRLALVARANRAQRASFRQLSAPHRTAVESVLPDPMLTLRDPQDAPHVGWDMYRQAVVPIRRQTVYPVRLARSLRRAPPAQPVRPDK